tara:strand:- start:15 stop:2588 length:2574 start_codon:yes stop_codon:yes gene_type:complete
MPKSQFLQSSFASGELSPLITGRTDLEQYYKGGQKAENVVIVPQGGIKRRPGTVFIASPLKKLQRNTTLPTMPNGGNASFINDGNDETYGISDANLTGTTEIAKYTFTSSPNARFIDLKNVSIQTIDNVEQTATISVEFSPNNIVWIAFSPPLPISSFSVISQRYALPDDWSSSILYYRITTNLTGATNRVKIGEYNLKTETTNLSNVKTFDFSYGADEHYLGVLTEGNMRFFRAPYEGGAETIYAGDVILPYLSAEIPSVRDAQTENVMLTFQENHEPQRIIFRPNVAFNFTSGPIPFINVPQYDYDDTDSPAPVSAVQVLSFPNNIVNGTTYQIDIEGVLSKNITYAGDNGLGGLEAESTAFNMQKNLQEMPIFGDTGVAVTRTGAGQFTITISGESAKPLKLFSAFATSGTNTSAFTFSRLAVGVSRKENVWSATRGYPLMGAFNDGRLWLGGTQSKRQSLFASKSGDLFNFFAEEGADDDGIFVTINSRNLTEIVDVNPDRGLQVFCSGAEFIVKGNTPSTVTIEAETQLGSFALESKSLDGATLFVNGNGNTLRQYLYNFNEDAYTSNDISVLSSHLINKPLDMAVLDGTSSQDANWVFLVNQDGTGAVLNTVRSQDINGFTKWIPNYVSATENTKLESVSTVGKELYVVSDIVSNVDSTVFQSIEKWDFNALFDTQVEFEAQNDGQAATVSLGNAFRSSKVGVIVNGIVLPDRTANSSGQITFTVLERSAFTYPQKIIAGHNIPVAFKSMPLNTNAGTRGGQNAMKEKKITRMNLRVLDTAGVYIDGNPVAVREFGESASSPLNTAVTPKTGIIEDRNGGNGWSTEVVPLITAPNATPFHLQAIEYEVESS